MKRVTLVNPPYEHAGSVLPPLGLLYIAAALRDSGTHIDVVDANPLGYDEATLANAVGECRPDIVGISVATPQFGSVQDLCRRIKTLLPEVLLILGGPHPTALPDISLQETCADIVVVGEGEKTMRELVRRFDRSADSLGKLAGLVIRTKTGIRHNPPRAPIANLGKLPFPARDLVSLDDYGTAGVTRHPFATILTSRGCPSRCIYCTKDVFGAKFRARDPDNVLNEIDHLILENGIRELDMLDDNFSLDRQRAEAICDGMIARRLNLPWRCSNGLRVDTVNKRLLEKMRAAGCYQVAFGVESGDDSVLRDIGKGIDCERISLAFELAKRAGLETTGFFMLGLPTDTVETMQKTIDFAIDLNPDFAQFTIATPLPGTSLYKWYCANYPGKEVDWRKFDFFGGKASFETENFSKADVEELYGKAYRRFYMRPKYLIRRLSRIRTLDDVKAKLCGLRTVLRLAK